MEAHPLPFWLKRTITIDHSSAVVTAACHTCCTHCPLLPVPAHSKTVLNSLLSDCCHNSTAPRTSFPQANLLAPAELNSLLVCLR